MSDPEPVSAPIAVYQSCSVLKSTDLTFIDAQVKHTVRTWLNEWAETQRARLRANPERAVALRITCELVDESASTDDWCRVVDTTIKKFSEFAVVARDAIEKWHRMLRHQSN